jgi:hypothetical protein
MNIGVQHEFHRGMVFTADYLRNVSTHNLMSIDTNHIGDSRFINLANAQTAITNTNAAFGCADVDCAIGHGATITDYASNGLDSGYSVCGGLACPSLDQPGLPHARAAFPGINQSVGTNQMLFPIGRSVYNGLQMSLRQNVSNPLPGIRYLNLQVSYAFSRYVSQPGTTTSSISQPTTPTQLTTSGRTVWTEPINSLSAGRWICRPTSA